MQWLANILREIIAMIITNSKVVRVNVLPSPEPMEDRAYSNGDCVGRAGAGNDAGKLIILNAVRGHTSTGVLNSLCFFDTTFPAHNVPMEVYIYSGKPMGEYPDNGAWPGIGDGDDHDRILGVVEITADDYINGFVQKTGLGIIVKSDEYETLYATIRLGADVTLSGESFLVFGFLQD